MHDQVELTIFGCFTMAVTRDSYHLNQCCESRTVPAGTGRTVPYRPFSGTHNLVFRTGLRTGIFRPFRPYRSFSGRTGHFPDTGRYRKNAIFFFFLENHNSIVIPYQKKYVLKQNKISKIIKHVILIKQNKSHPL